MPLATSEATQRWSHMKHEHEGVPVPPRSLTRTGGWYDLAIAVDGDSQFEYHIARHLENGEDGISDPIMGGLA